MSSVYALVSLPISDDKAGDRACAKLSDAGLAISFSSADETQVVVCGSAESERVPDIERACNEANCQVFGTDLRRARALVSNLLFSRWNRNQDSTAISHHELVAQLSPLVVEEDALEEAIRYWISTKPLLRADRVGKDFTRLTVTPAGLRLFQRQQSGEQVDIDAGLPYLPGAEPERSAVTPLPNTNDASLPSSHRSSVGQSDRGQATSTLDRSRPQGEILVIFDKQRKLLVVGEVECDVSKAPQCWSSLLRLAKARSERSRAGWRSLSAKKSQHKSRLEGLRKFLDRCKPGLARQLIEGGGGAGKVGKVRFRTSCVQIGEQILTQSTAGTLTSSEIT